MYEKMLVPLDGSELSERILPYAIELARRCGSTVTLLQAVESMGQVMATMAPADPGALTPGTAEALVEGVEAEGKAAGEYLVGIASRFTAAGVAATTAVFSGPAGDAILQQVEKDGTDVVAMSSHGRGGLGRAFLGSVADHVIRHAAVPVLVLRAHEGA